MCVPRDLDKFPPLPHTITGIKYPQFCKLIHVAAEAQNMTWLHPLTDTGIAHQDTDRQTN